MRYSSLSTTHARHTAPPSEIELRVKALESLLTEKGLVDPQALELLIDTYENKIGPKNGAKVVAHAWVDPAYKRRLLDNATAAIAELGFSGVQGEDMIVVENTPTVHNLVVCTLCSCYPWPTLGLPPVWYKSAPYRASAVLDRRGVLQEFGLELAENVEIRVWDSNAELRYMVLPARPPGTEHMTEEQCDRIVVRNINPTGHTRLPRYVRGKGGVVHHDHGVFVFPDTSAHGEGPKPQHVYSVRFEAHDLWGREVPSRDSLYIDLWDDYIDPLNVFQVTDLTPEGHQYFVKPCPAN